MEKSGVLVARTQAVSEKYRLQHRTKEDLIKELEDEIREFENKYNGKFEDVFGEVKDPYELDEPDDYFNWRDSLEKWKKL